MTAENHATAHVSENMRGQPSTIGGPVQAGDATQLLESVITQGAGLPEGAFDRLGVEGSFILVGTAFEVAAQRRFPKTPDSLTVSEYVSEIRGRFPESSKLVKADVAEAVLWAALGNEKMLEGITIQEIFSVGVLGTYAIVNDLELSEDETAAYIGDVVKRAALHAENPDEPEN